MVRGRTKYGSTDPQRPQCGDRYDNTKRQQQNRLPDLIPLIRRQRDVQHHARQSPVDGKKRHDEELREDRPAEGHIHEARQRDGAIRARAHRRAVFQDVWREVVRGVDGVVRQDG